MYAHRPAADHVADMELRELVIGHVEHAEAAGLRVVDRFSFGPDYAETLRRWRAAFMARLDGVRKQGFDERFVRLWEFYLAYCEAAFDAGNTDVMQFTLQAG